MSNSEYLYNGEKTLLGHKVKDGQRVRLRNGEVAKVTEANINDDNRDVYSFTVAVAGENDSEITITESGRWVLGQEKRLDVIEVLDIPPCIKNLPACGLCAELAGHVFRNGYGRDLTYIGEDPATSSVWCHIFGSELHEYRTYSKDGSQGRRDFIAEYIGEYKEPLVIEVGEEYEDEATGENVSVLFASKDFFIGVNTRILSKPLSCEVGFFTQSGYPIGENRGEYGKLIAKEKA